VSIRVYVPSSYALLREAVVSGGIGPSPLLAHAVTDALRAELADGTDEDWEYVAMTAAAQDSLALLTDEDPPRRVVIAVDVDSVLPVEHEDLTLVEVAEVVPLRAVAAVHVDAEDAEDAVAEARPLWERAAEGDEKAAAVVERCTDHELGWYATQEIGTLLEAYDGQAEATWE
jgi:hypothetical protein